MYQGLSLFLPQVIPGSTPLRAVEFEAASLPPVLVETSFSSEARGDVLSQTPAEPLSSALWRNDTVPTEAPLDLKKAIAQECDRLDIRLLDVSPFVEEAKSASVERGLEILRVLKRYEAAEAVRLKSREWIREKSLLNSTYLPPQEVLDALPLARVADEWFRAEQDDFATVQAVTADFNDLEFQGVRQLNVVPEILATVEEKAEKLESIYRAPGFQRFVQAVTDREMAEIQSSGSYQQRAELQEAFVRLQYNENTLQVLRAQETDPNTVMLIDSFEADQEEMKGRIRELISGLIDDVSEIPSTKGDVASLRQDLEVLEDYESLIERVDEAAFLRTVDSRMVLLESWVKESTKADGARKFITGVTIIHVASKFKAANGRYAETLALWEKGDHAGARKMLLEVERMGEIKILAKTLEGEQSVIFWSGVGIVVAAGVVSAVGGEVFAPELIGTLGSFWGGAAVLGVNGVAFAASHRYFSADVFGDSAHDLSFAEEAALNTAMMGILAKSFQLFGQVAQRGLVRLAERQLIAEGKIAAGSELQVLLQDSQIAARVVSLQESPAIQAALMSGAFGTELLGFGTYDFLAANYQLAKQGVVNPAAAVASTLSLEAWKERFVFLVALKAGGALASPITKPMHEMARGYALGKYETQLSELEIKIGASRAGLEKLLSEGGNLKPVLKSFKEALAQQKAILDNVPEYRDPTTYALNAHMLGVISEFEKAYEAAPKERPSLASVPMASASVLLPALGSVMDAGGGHLSWGLVAAAITGGIAMAFGKRTGKADAMGDISKDNAHADYLTKTAVAQIKAQLGFEADFYEVSERVYAELAKESVNSYGQTNGNALLDRKGDAAIVDLIVELYEGRAAKEILSKPLETSEQAMQWVDTLIERKTQSLSGNLPHAEWIRLQDKLRTQLMSALNKRIFDEFYVDTIEQAEPEFFRPILKEFQKQAQEVVVSRVKEAKLAVASTSANSYLLGAMALMPAFEGLANNHGVVGTIGAVVLSALTLGIASVWSRKPGVKDLDAARDPEAPQAVLKELAISPDVEVRRSIASNPTTPPQTLIELAQEFPREFLQNAALPMLLIETPNLFQSLSVPTAQALMKADILEPFVMECLACHPDRSVRLAAVQRLQPSEEALLQGKDLQSLTKMALDPDASPALLLRLSMDDHFAVREAVAENQNVSSELLSEMAGDETLGVPQRVAEHFRTSINDLFRLAEDVCWQVRATVAENPNATTDLLELLSQDGSSEVRRSVVMNPKTPPDLLPALYEGLAGNAAFKVFELPKIQSLKALESLSGHADPYVRYGVAQNPNTPVWILQRLCLDKVAAVRKYAEATLKKVGNP